MRPELAKRSIADVSAAIRQAETVAVFIGAGVSVSAGIPTAGGIIEDAARTFLGGAEVPRDRLWDWLRGQRFFNQDDAYASVLDAALPSASARAKYFERLILGRRPSAAHIAIAKLFASGRCSIVATTNFDQLMEYAVCRVCGHTPAVLMADELPLSSTGKSRRPTVLKLHGDYLYGDIRNLGHELWATRERMARTLSIVSEAGPVIVAGYSGGDASVMGTLSELASQPTSFEGGLFWLTLAGSELSPSVTGVLEATQDRGSGIVESNGADAFFSDLGSALGDGPTSYLPRLPDHPHLTPVAEGDWIRIGTSWLGSSGHAAFTAQLRNNPEFWTFGQTAAGFDAMIASFEARGECSANIGDFIDRYLDILAGALLPSNVEQTVTKYARRRGEIVALGFGDSNGQSTTLHGSAFESYMAALALTDTSNTQVIA